MPWFSKKGNVDLNHQNQDGVVVEDGITASIRAVAEDSIRRIRAAEQAAHESVKEIVSLDGKAGDLLHSAEVVIVKRLEVKGDGFLSVGYTHVIDNPLGSCHSVLGEVNFTEHRGSSPAVPAGKYRAVLMLIRDA